MSQNLSSLIRKGDLPPDPGPAGWNHLLPPRRTQPALQCAVEADYAVVGAGFAGLSAARRILQLEPDARVVVLEAREVASGPAGRNSGFMIDLPHDLASDDYAGSSAENDRRQTVLNRAAIRFACQAAIEYAMPAEAVNTCGKVNAAATVKGLKHNAEYARHLEALGEEYKLLDATQMQELTGVKYYQGGLWTPGTAILQPALYIRGLAAGLRQYSGYQLYEHSPVAGLNQADSSWQVKTLHGQVNARKVILAVNGLVQQFGLYTGRLMHVFTYASMTRALTPSEVALLGGELNWGFTPADPMGTTVRRISGMGGDRIVVRNRFTYDPGMTVSDTRLRRVAQDHHKAYLARFPMLNEVNMEYCWGGRLCLSLNGVFALGEVAAGLYSACCQNGLGTAKGTLAGIVAAEQAVGVTTADSLVPEYEPEEAPQRLWPEPFMALGANGYMRWKEWRAGREF